MSTNRPPESLTIDQLFHKQRINDFITKIFTTVLLPIGIVLFIIRIFIGFHAFIVACLLRKSTALRSIVLRLMCTILGVVVQRKGERDETTRVMCGNHVSILDHLAVDLITPCLLPSVWDIPGVIRWCFGYVDLAASRGRSELISNAKKLLESEELPLLAFPEGIITSGNTALLKFNSWSFEISESVQPIAIRLWRPVPWNVAASRIASTWWTDLVYFFALPFTVITVKYLPKVEKFSNETIEEFSSRVANVIASDLGILVSEFETRDAAEAAKRWKRDNEINKQINRSKEKASTRVLDPKQLDECAMRIKQSYPAFHLSVIRRDLEKTRNQAATVNNLKTEKISKEFSLSSGKITHDTSSWKNIYADRKWDMIEANRSKYLGRDG